MVEVGGGGHGGGMDLLGEREIRRVMGWSRAVLILPSQVA
jgi:hypothetical protein